MSPKIKAALQGQLIGAICFAIGGMMLIGPAAIFLVFGGVTFVGSTYDYVMYKRAELDEDAE